ncbi:MAG: ABATE domain-containing protein [Thermodesulfobacteriota bacterium]
MPSKIRAAGNLELVGGHVGLDFTNTTSSRAAAHPAEYLTSYGALVDWSLHAGLLSREEAGRLRQAGVRRPAKAAAVLARALEVREILFRLFSALAQKKAPHEDDLEGLNRALSDTLGRLRVQRVKNRFAWGWAKDPDALEAMLWPIVRSAAELLTRPESSQVGQCANSPYCQWLFLDKSKNNSRRWCSMDLCGSRDKVKRYYRRKKQGG